MTAVAANRPTARTSERQERDSLGGSGQRRIGRRGELHPEQVHREVVLAVFAHAVHKYSIEMRESAKPV